LAALDKPLSGQITVAGVDVLEHPRTTHRNVGFLADFFGLYTELTVWQCLLYAAHAHGVASEQVHAAVQRAAERLQISGRLGDKAGSLSRGLAQRLAVAQAIVHEPGVLFLDEPASGLDPEARNALAQLFLALRDQGMTLMVSSHILAELEAYSTDMLIMRHGRIVEHVPLEQKYADAVRIRLRLCAPYENLQQCLEGEAGVTELQLDGDGALFRYAGDEQARHAMLCRLINRGVPVSAFAEQSVNLQDAYLQTLDTHTGAGA
jgi:ABC-2 type transport system ATP-binding protein